jgi:hypothetical protein
MIEELAVILMTALHPPAQPPRDPPARYSCNLLINMIGFFGEERVVSELKKSGASDAAIARARRICLQLRDSP